MNHVTSFRARQNLSVRDSSAFRWTFRLFSPIQTQIAMISIADLVPHHFKQPCIRFNWNHEPELNINHLARLPFEMLVEVLSQITSPDILALSRTSRYFCATLVTNPASQFIWRDARKRFLPQSIPDPAPNWTESAYIAFIFDPEPCEARYREYPQMSLILTRYPGLRASHKSNALFVCPSCTSVSSCMNRFLQIWPRLRSFTDKLSKDVAQVRSLPDWLSHCAYIATTNRNLKMVPTADYNNASDPEAAHLVAVRSWLPRHEAAIPFQWNRYGTYHVL